MDWRLSRTAQASFVLDALEQALADRRPVQGRGLVHHSDRGVQYVSIRYTERLAEAGPPWNGSSGSTTDASSHRSETYLPLKPKRNTMPSLRHSRWRRDSEKPASDKPSAVHIAVTADGVPVACAATAANVHDTLMFERLFLAAFAVMARIATVFADKGYDAEPHRALCRDFGAEPHIHKRGQPHGSGLGQRRWPVERSNPWRLENKRPALRYDRLGFIVQALLQAACPFLVAENFAREL
jgi:transposase InsO family protein